MTNIYNSRELKGADKLGYYFDAKNTRKVVSDNFNTVRELFRLSTPKLTDLAQPITKIPYSKFRRLMGGERDISVEELNTLYELLAVPPTTFMFPWSIPMPTGRTGLFAKGEKQVANPIFDSIGTPVFPYEISGKENWLPAQLICRALTSSEILFALKGFRGTSRLLYFEDMLQEMALRHAKELFPINQYKAAFRALYDRYPAQEDGSLLISDVADYLTYFGHALLEYMRKEATLNLYQQLVKASKESMFMRCYGDRAFSSAFQLWMYDDNPLDTLFQLVGYAGVPPFDSLVRISKPLGKENELLTMTAKDSSNGSTLCSVTIPFSYQKWFSGTMPTTVTISGLQGKTPESNINEIVIWEGEIYEELYDKESRNPPYRRFPYLYPVLTTPK